MELNICRMGGGLPYAATPGQVNARMPSIVIIDDLQIHLEKAEMIFKQAARPIRNGGSLNLLLLYMDPWTRFGQALPLIRHNCGNRIVSVFIDIIDDEVYSSTVDRSITNQDCYPGIDIILDLIAVPPPCTVANFQPHLCALTRGVEGDVPDRIKQLGLNYVDKKSLGRERVNDHLNSLIRELPVAAWQ